MKKTFAILIIVMLLGFTIKAQLNLQNGLVAYYPLTKVVTKTMELFMYQL